MTDSPTPPAEAPYVPVGRVGKRHGLDGSFFVEAASEEPERFAVGAHVYVDGERLAITAAKRSGGRPVIRLECEVRRGAELAVRRDELPPTEEGEYYAFELVGLQAEDEDGRPVGRVTDVEPGIANDVLVLDAGLLLPLVEDCVREIDLDGGRIVIATAFAEPPLP